MRDDISQEDIERAIRRAGSTRRFIDRQDYVMALKELGGGAVLRDGIRYSDVNDHDLSEFILHAEGGGTEPGAEDDMFKLLKKPVNFVGLPTDTALFRAVGGWVSLVCFGKITADIVIGDATSVIKIGAGTVPDKFLSTHSAMVGTAGMLWVGNSPKFGMTTASPYNSSIFIEPGTDVKVTMIGLPFIGGEAEIYALWYPVDDGATLEIV